VARGKKRECKPGEGVVPPETQERALFAGFSGIKAEQGRRRRRRREEGGDWMGYQAGEKKGGVTFKMRPGPLNFLRGGSCGQHGGLGFPKNRCHRTV
jgi:hypothetical protein